MAYELIWEDRGVVWRYRDVIAVDEVIQANLNIYPDPRFETLEYQLVIFSELVVYEPTAASVRRVAEMDASAALRNPNLVVGVVGIQALLRGITNLYRLRHEAAEGSWRIDYFESEKAARQWIAEALA